MHFGVTGLICYNELLIHLFIICYPLTSLFSQEESKLRDRVFTYSRNIHLFVIALRIPSPKFGDGSKYPLNWKIGNLLPSPHFGEGIRNAHDSFVIWYLVKVFARIHEIRTYSRIIVLDGYCSTVQGLLDWFEVDLGFTELSFIHEIRTYSRIIACVRHGSSICALIYMCTIMTWHTTRQKEIYQFQSWTKHILRKRTHFKRDNTFQEREHTRAYMTRERTHSNRENTHVRVKKKQSAFQSSLEWLSTLCGMTDLQSNTF